MSVLRNEVLDASISILGSSTRRVLSSRLDSRKLLLSPKGYRRDWRGLAVQAGIDEGSISSGKISDTEFLFQKWRVNGGTISELIRFLEEMDRFDVIDDTLELIYDDYDRSKKEIHRGPTIDPESVYDPDILTLDDVKNRRAGLGLQHYDALVLFADEDIDFVQTLVEKLEGEYGLKLCIKDRDLVAGLQFETEAVVRVITERCSRVIVVLSPEFLASNVNRYFTGFAHALSVDQRSRIIIPCQLKRCDRPAIISFCHSLDYFRAQGSWNYWEKLRDSLIVSPPMQQSLPNVSSRATIQELPSVPALPSSPESINSNSPSSSRSFFSKLLRKGDSYGKFRIGSPESTLYQANKLTGESDSMTSDHEVTHNSNGHVSSSAIPINKVSASAMNVSLSSASGESSDFAHMLDCLPSVPKTPPSPMSTSSSKVLLLPDASPQSPKSLSVFSKIFKGKHKRKDYA